MIEINNLTKFRVDKKFFTALAKKIIKSENIKIESLSVAFVSAGEMKKLNKKYRGKKNPTDVLSFGEKSGDLAEIVICPDVAKENAKKYRIAFQDELEKLFVHGMLHVAGYDHESEKEAEEMEAQEENYLSNLK